MSRRRVLAGVVTAVVALAVGACGSSKHPARVGAAGSTETTLSTGATAPGSATAAGKRTRTSTTTKGGGSAAGPPTTPAPTGVPITATFASACVRPGETQTITITTVPESGVAYDAVYSDGKNGTSPGYYGGNKGGRTDKAGVWNDTWAIAAAAPPGPVRVDIVAATSQGTGTAYALFTLANASGRCSS